ncbi:MAG: hypothetical protein JNN17_25930 [Verrucomicrobiaceae bacterium]|nr:hypothetical protein [Verrucomicrobiaceae bacterium]
MSRPLIALLFLFVAQAWSAELKLAGLFTDHMVLQRDQAVAVWGFATPGEEIVVVFGNQTKVARAIKNGRWSINLDPMTANAVGRDLLVRCSAQKQEAKLKDVVVGDVWLCSGQSNMHFQMKSVENFEKEIAAANQPSVRFFTVEHQFVQMAAKDVRGVWKPVSPQTAADCSAVACYFGMALQPKISVPVGLIVSSVGGTRIETWMRPETLAATGEGTALIEKWKAVSPEEFEKIGTTYREFQRQRDEVHPQAVKAAKARGEPPPPAPKMPKLRCHDSPSSLHNGMIAPLEQFAFRGAVWYQGESNAGQGKAYEKLLPAMLADWRKVWGGKLPFLFVQLAPHRSIHPSFRESQARIWQSTPHTAMVVTTDVGNAENIHPTRKRPVGERLALAARAMVYGESLESSGPVFKAMQIEGQRAILSFTHLGGGLVAEGGPLKGFTIAGENEKFFPAQAVIEGETIVVTSDKVAAPKTVRFGWAQVPEVNLFNREGLPAVPFTAR